jgi:hypothetical protein
VAVITKYANDGLAPCAELLLESGEKVRLALDARGMRLVRGAGQGGEEEVLFSADSDLSTLICAAFLDRMPAEQTTPLDIMLDAVAGFRSARELRLAFAAAVAAVGG